MIGNHGNGDRRRGFMYNYEIYTLVVGRQRVFMQQTAQLPGIVRGRPSVVVPPSVVVGSPTVN